jgi:hypothetical protein
LWCLLLLGPLLAWTGILNNRRERPSLQWPKVTGTIFRSEWHYVGHHSKGVFLSYSYRVNDQHYLGTRVNLWNPNGRDENSEVTEWVATHPVHMTVYVYYDPQHPENSVLEPGADEFRNGLSIWVGSILFVCLLPLVYSASRYLNKVIAWRKANPPKMRAAQEHKNIEAFPRGFLSYEPASKQKLNCFATRVDLEQFIGHGGKALQQWKPDDRIIDAQGQEYRLTPNALKTRYELDPTGETWSWESLLELAVTDAELRRDDPDSLRCRVTDAPAENRIPVLMKCVDQKAMDSWSSCIAITLFLLVFFLAVVFGGIWLFKMLHLVSLPPDTLVRSVRHSNVLTL